MPTTFDVERLYYALDLERRRRRTTWTAIARKVEVAPNTLTRLGQGMPCSVQTLARLMAWLGETDLAPFLTTDSPKPNEP